MYSDNISIVACKGTHFCVHGNTSVIHIISKHHMNSFIFEKL